MSLICKKLRMIGSAQFQLFSSVVLFAVERKVWLDVHAGHCSKGVEPRTSRRGVLGRDCV